MSTDEKIKAAYDFLMFNFTHAGNGERIPGKNRVYYGKGQEFTSGATAYATVWALFYDQEGVCYNFTDAMVYMLERIGIRANPCGEQAFYRNADGTLTAHYWCEIDTDDGRYWYDIDVDGSMTRRNGGTASYTFYKKTVSQFISTHEFDGYTFNTDPLSSASGWARPAIREYMRYLSDHQMHDYQAPLKRFEFANLLTGLLRPNTDFTSMQDAARNIYPDYSWTGARGMFRDSGLLYDSPQPAMPSLDAFRIMTLNHTADNAAFLAKMREAIEESYSGPNTALAVCPGLMDVPDPDNQQYFSPQAYRD
jgi:hypothetical protein